MKLGKSIIIKIKRPASNFISKVDCYFDNLTLILIDDVESLINNNILSVPEGVYDFYLRQNSMGYIIWEGSEEW